MNNPFDYIPDKACDEAFAKLLRRLEGLRESEDPADRCLVEELNAGKMIGVLLADDPSGRRETLYAFSGQIGKAGFRHHWFVEPVFDYLCPDGRFKRGEREISAQSREIELFRNGTLREAECRYCQAQEEADSELAAFREKCRESKSRRDSIRKSGEADEAQLAAMIRQSQFEKAELRRLGKRLEDRVLPYKMALEKARLRFDGMKRKRKEDSEALQKWLFSSFRVQNANGEYRSLAEIFAATPLRIPPSGAGECCAPKLLQAAYVRGLKPVAMAEYWCGRPKGGEMRIHGSFYPACRGKCGPVLGWMLRGLSIEPPIGREQGRIATDTPVILFENEWFCVVSKPSGMLSVPGKDGSLSAEEWLAEKYRQNDFVRMAHRLDQDTSGLIVAAFSEEAYRILQSLFASRRVTKRYVADLDGDYVAKGGAKAGRILLPIAADWLDRPRQRVDPDGGKASVTDYEFQEAANGRSRVIFRPLTGRTHQLRVHAASEQGLGMPIVGDRLYGRNAGNDSPRLHLHAWRLEFTFPVDGHRYSFESPVPFSL